MKSLYEAYMAAVRDFYSKIIYIIYKINNFNIGYCVL